MESQGGQTAGSGGGTETAEGEDEESSSSSLNQSPQAQLRSLLDDDNRDGVGNYGDQALGGTGNVKSSDDSNAGVNEVADNTLEEFRQQWRSELQKAAPNSKATSRDSSPAVGSAVLKHGQKESTPEDRRESSTEYEASSKNSVFETASRLFQNGIDFERKGQMHDAIRSYRQALLLVPDIEKRLLTSSSASSVGSSTRTYAMVASKPTENKGTRSDDVDSFVGSMSSEELIEIFQHRLFITNGGRAICTLANDDEPIEEKTAQANRQATHISQLPVEVLMHIFKWTVSSELDLRQLEQLSMVCCGFYILARDPELWRLACLKVWGVRTGILDSMYPSWRQMIIQRPHLWYNGVYISKITYVRHGETSYQDQFYRPWHLVVYYRYLRFFADGGMIMLTTPDEPSLVVPFLKSRQPRLQGIVKGTYRLLGHDCVAGVLTRKHAADSTSSPYIRSRFVKQPTDLIEHIFSLVLSINAVKRRPHVQLAWSNYEVTARYRNGQTSMSKFDLCDQKFPPLYFSRVKSFSAYSEAPLE